MGIDEDAIAFRKWQPSVEARLAALETRPVNSESTITANVAISPEFQKELDDLKEALAKVTVNQPEIDGLRTEVADLLAEVAALKAQVTDTSGVLAGVEAALGSHGHPPSPPAEPVPVEPAAAPEAPSPEAAAAQP